MKPTLSNPVLVTGFSIKSQIVGLTTDYTNSNNAIAHATL